MRGFKHYSFLRLRKVAFFLHCHFWTRKLLRTPTPFKEILLLYLLKLWRWCIKPSTKTRILFFLFLLSLRFIASAKTSEVKSELRKCGSGTLLGEQTRSGRPPLLLPLGPVTALNFLTSLTICFLSWVTACVFK